LPDAAEPRKRSQAMKLDHIQLAMPKGGEERARCYFVDTLGFLEEAKPEPLRARGGCWFRKGEAIVHMGIDPEFAPQRKAHPAFLIEDLRGLASSLEKSGFTVSWDDTLAERSRCYSSDPFGNRLELMQEGSGFCQW